MHFHHIKICFQYFTISFFFQIHLFLDSPSHPCSYMLCFKTQTKFVGLIGLTENQTYGWSEYFINQLKMHWNESDWATQFLMRLYLVNTSGLTFTKVEFMFNYNNMEAQCIPYRILVKLLVFIAKEFQSSQSIMHIKSCIPYIISIKISIFEFKLEFMVHHSIFIEIKKIFKSYLNFIIKIWRNNKL